MLNQVYKAISHHISQIIFNLNQMKMKKMKCNLMIACLTILMTCQVSLGQNQAKKIEGKMKGVVELGSDGFNSFIITVDKNKNWKLEKAEYGNSNVLEGAASESTVLLGLKTYIKGFVDFGVPSNEIHFVASSGALIMKSTIQILKGLKTLGYVVNEVTPGEEGKLAFVCVMPNSEKNSAYVIDVGAGNTKVSWMQNDEIITKSSYGSKYYLEFVEDEEAYSKLKEVGTGIPKNFSKKAYVIGGVPYKLAKQTRQNKERYTVLSKLELYEPKNEKQRGGLNILKALKDGTGSEQFIFDWDSNFTIGFLLQLPY